MSDLTNLLDGIRTAVEELPEIRLTHEKNKTIEDKAHIRLAELSVLQMAETLVDKTAYAHKLEEDNEALLEMGGQQAATIFRLYFVLDQIKYAKTLEQAHNLARMASERRDER